MTPLEKIAEMRRALDLDVRHGYNMEVVKLLDAIAEEIERHLDRLGKPAHTYASENADLYHGFDAGVRRCSEALRPLAAVLRGEGGKDDR